MANKTMFENIKSFGVKQVLSFVAKAPEKNVLKILDWMIKNDKEGFVTNQVSFYTF